MKILNEIKPEWEQYRLSIIGFAFIVAAWIFWLGQTEWNRYACMVLLVASGVIEAILAIQKERLISKWIQPQFRPLADLIILLVISIVSIYWIHTHWVEVIHNHSVYLGWILAILASHFFFHGD